MSEANFLFVACKDDSVDNCMGCKIAHYGSDFHIQNWLTEQGLIDLWAHYLQRNLNLDHNETGYEFWIFKGGKTVWDDGPCWNGQEHDTWGYDKDEVENEWKGEAWRLNFKAEDLAKLLQKEKLEKEAAKKAAEEAKIQAEAKEQRRKQLELLQKEFS